MNKKGLLQEHICEQDRTIKKSIDVNNITKDTDYYIALCELLLQNANGKLGIISLKFTNILFLIIHFRFKHSHDN